MDTPAVGACRWLRLVARSENGLLVLLLAATIVLAAVQIVRRNVFEAGLVWGEPLVRLIVLWVGLTGAVVASRIDRHIHVNVLARLLPARFQHAARAYSTDAFTRLVCAVVAWHAARFVAAEYPAETEAFDGVPVWVAAFICPRASA